MRVKSPQTTWSAWGNRSRVANWGRSSKTTGLNPTLLSSGTSALEMCPAPKINARSPMGSCIVKHFALTVFSSIR